MSEQNHEISMAEAAYSGVFNGAFAPEDNTAIHSINPALARAAIIRTETRGVPTDSRKAFLLGVALAEQALQRETDIRSLSEALANPQLIIEDTPSPEAA